MENAITLFTIPHTGTHFAISLFEAFGIDGSIKYKPEAVCKERPRCKPFPQGPRPFWWLAHCGSTREYMDPLMPSLINAKKLIVTARDPYLSAIRYFRPGTNRTMDSVKRRWDHFFEILEGSQHGYFVLNIDCRKEHRHKHIADLCNFLNQPYDQRIELFVNSWKPKNVSNTEAKRKYLETGQLPNCGNWSLLDLAVEWYKGLNE